MFSLLDRFSDLGVSAGETGEGSGVIRATAPASPEFLVSVLLLFLCSLPRAAVAMSFFWGVLFPVMNGGLTGLGRLMMTVS